MKRRADELNYHAGMRHALLLGLVLILGGLWNAQAAKVARPCWGTVVVGHQTEEERLATLDYQRYIAEVTGMVPRQMDFETWRAHPVPAVILGSVENNPLFANFGEMPSKQGVQGYCLVGQDMLGVPVVAALGQTPAGGVNAVYGLLRELGYGFFLGSESVPESLPDTWPHAAPIVRQPALAMRGVLPWYNFFNSPTTWDPVDHRALVDQLIRQGANFVGFHTYDAEPFAAYEEDGKMHWGARLLDTRSPTWGTHPAPAGEFAFGISKLYDTDYFGAATTRMTGDERAVIQREQDLLGDALQYARQRGLFTCLGFEINGDPTLPQDREIFLKRIERLLNQYPALDYIWIWQPETQGAQGYAAQYHGHPLRDRWDSSSRIDAYGQARRVAFDRAVERTTGERPFFQDNEPGRMARAREGARLEQFALLARNLMAQRRNPPRLVVSGWGGDERLLGAEYFSGLDQLLPEDVVFSALDHIIPRERVDAVYGALSAARQRWPIPWLEFDGDQWQPQPCVRVLESTMRDILSNRCQGVLGIHWRTRDLEENFAYMVDAAWQPGLTAAQFFEGFARRAYPAAIAGEMARIHLELDTLGYRWVNGGGQGECASFAWGPGTAEQRAKLEVLRQQVHALRTGWKPAHERLDWLLRVMDWVLAYQQAEQAAVEARQFLDQGKAAEALALLEGRALAEAMRAFALRVTTRGEYGVLATINTKAVVAWRQMHQECLKRLGRPEAGLPAPDWSPAKQVVVPRLITSVEEGRPFEFQVLSMGGAPLWVHYRTLGRSEWMKSRVEPSKGWVQNVIIPATAVRSPGFEYGFSFGGAVRDPGDSLLRAVTVFPEGFTRRKPRLLIEHPVPGPIEVSAGAGDTHLVELNWKPLPQAVYYKVHRDGVWLCDTAVPYFPDTPASIEGEHTYRIEAWSMKALVAAAELKANPVALPFSGAPFTNQLKVTTTVRPGGVMVTWPEVASRQVYAFEVQRRPEGDSVTPATVVATLPVSRRSQHEHWMKPDPGQWRYALVPKLRGGGQAEPATWSQHWPETWHTNKLDWPLQALPDGASKTGAVELGEDGARFEGGLIKVPHQEGMNHGLGMTLRFEFNAASVEGMPVLLSHGAWQRDGWYVQMLDGRLILRTTGGDAQGPKIETGRWYQVCWEYDGFHHRLVVDGQEVQAARRLEPTPAIRSLRFGQYSEPQPQHAFYGRIRRVSIESITRP